MKTQKQTALIQVHGQTLTTNSLIIAEVFNRPHKNVLRVLDGLKSRLKIEPRDYVVSRGKTQRMYELSERQALIAMPFIGGEKSFYGQEILVDAFLKMHKIISDPDRQQAIRDKRDTARPMTDGLVFVRDMLGKKTCVNHFCNEHLFVNRAFTGEWKPIDETTLDTYDLRLLKVIRERNTLLIQHYPVQKDRKELMDKFVADYRAKYPRFTLVE